MEIETKLGTLKARIIRSDEYPGMSVGLVVDGQFIEYAWIEVDQSACCEKPTLKIHVFDSVNDEQVFNLDQTEEDIKKFFER